jgi:hypothetical protein
VRTRAPVAAVFEGLHLKLVQIRKREDSHLSWAPRAVVHQSEVTIGENTAACPSIRVRQQHARADIAMLVA